MHMNTKKPVVRDATYYVFGSGLMPVPLARMNEVPRLKLEFHAVEAARALFLARARRTA